MQKRWDVTPDLTKAEKENARQIASSLNCPLVIAELLYRKNIHDSQQLEGFFHSELQMLHNPYLFHDMHKAVERILHAIQNGDRITIYGDYDVDGTTAVAVLYLGLQELNAIIDYYIPHRMIDGYGLSLSGLEQLKERGTSLIITVDCGIIAFEEVNTINNMGMQIIITDHHNAQSELPNAYAILNPKLEGCGYPFTDLAGVGVAYKLLMAIYTKLGKDTLENKLRYLDLVAVGTIADIVSLTDENRIIASFGLKRLEERQNKGLTALMNIANMGSGAIDSNDIVFNLAPRINAAGRMGSAMRAVELLVSDDDERCRELATVIDNENTLRQQIDMKTYHEACEIIERKYKNLDDTWAIVISSDDWHQGIIGIISSKLIEKYYRPTILISYHEGMGSGSGRSIEAFDLFKAIEHTADLLDSYGGHNYAVGLKILPEYLDLFEQRLSDFIKQNIDAKQMIPPLKIDRKIEIYEINKSLMEWLDQFEPFGTHNQRPVFYTQRVMVQGYPYLVGKNHLKLKIIKDGCELDLIGYNLGDYISLIKSNSYLDIAYTLRLVTWQNNTFIQGNIRDLKITS